MEKKERERKKNYRTRDEKRKREKIELRKDWNECYGWPLRDTYLNAIHRITPRQRVTVKVHTTSIKYNTKCEKVLFNIKLFVIAARGLVLTASFKLHAMKTCSFFILPHSLVRSFALFHSLLFHCKLK